MRAKLDSLMMANRRRETRRSRRAAPDRAKSRRLWSIVFVTAAAFAALIIVFGLLMRRAQTALRRIPQQNVLLITIDTLRADALGSYGGPASTPALDRLASDGVRFTFAHAQTVVTLPSHATILTGQYPFRHGVRDNSGYRLAAGSTTVATILKQAGYATGAF